MKKTKPRKLNPIKTSKKSQHPRKAPKKVIVEKRTSASRLATVPSLHVPIHFPQPDLRIPNRPVFSIEIGSIGGDTTIGDLIVAFPRTRDVLMKHGLRFDVEEAGYLYMTLNVFSAIHGVSANSLVQELHTASKESPPQAVPTSSRSITVAPIQ